VIAHRRSGRSMARKEAGNDFLHLHRECVSALQIYMAEADKLCRMLESCNGDATSATEQVALVAQRQKENEAHAEYHRLRKRLLRRARLDSTIKTYYRMSSPTI